MAVSFEGSDQWLQGPEIDYIRESNGELHLILKEGADHQSILKRGLEYGVKIFRFDLVEPRLHEIFVRHARTESVGDAGLPKNATMELQ